MVYTFHSFGSEDFVGVQADNLPGTLLGVYKDPNTVFGITEANLTTQLVPTIFNPDFGDNPVLESVILHIPYFSTLQSTDDDGNNSYTLDSIYGNTGADYKLSIYRNNYLLRDLNPDADFENPQCYYSNQQDVFQATVSAADLIYENTAFRPNAAEYIIPGEVDPDTMIEGEPTRFPPGLTLDLTQDPNIPGTTFIDTTFFSELLFENASPADLSNQNLFVNYFKGLIFKFEVNNNDGTIFYVNLDGASIVVDYTNQEEMDAEEPFGVKDATVYNLRFSGNKVNTFNTINNEDVEGRQDNLYLKGGDGAFAEIDLFAGDIEDDQGGLVDALTYFKSKKDTWLINEADLVFYVNQDLVNGDEPERVVLYDLKNNEPIVDYFLDGTVNTTNPRQSRIGYSEILNRDSNGNGVRYKFRITNHINNILRRDSTNVKLGLYLTYNINQLADNFSGIITSKIQGVNNDEDDATIDALPPTSILSPKGTILYGSGNLPAGQKAELEIFYTEPRKLIAYVWYRWIYRQKRSVSYYFRRLKKIGIPGL
ncbi:DUF4270 domain-containing protein [Lacinutrix neustonica]|uniref:DUF4270 domain-containing protein n=1 Tax=Lacinutrix neustonica TaxID=2980107 RepID=A0A9E8MYT7_9FLAO|nr:DUF4270 domain-containing protein [Lacinutrix neustonica]WAC03881.1 DUF4270 domain-containing protein [Lacinutrix neustonica]